MTEKLYNLEAEKAVIGSVILHQESFIKIMDLLEAEDFYQTQNQKIYQTFVELFNSGSKIDLVILNEKLPGEASYLVECSNIATSAHIQKHADIIKNYSIRRQLLNAQRQNELLIMDEEKDIQTVLAETQSNLFNVNLSKIKDDSAVAVYGELLEVQKQYEEKMKQGQKYLGIETGIKKVDDLIDGLRPGHIWVVGGYTSSGKTQFALNIVHNVIEQGVPVSVISLEMSRVDMAARILGIRHNLSSVRIIKSIADNKAQEAVKEGKVFFNSTKLFLHTTYFELEKIKMIIRKDVYTKGVKLVVVDYVQNIISKKGLREYDLLTQSATDLQALARELGITIYIVSQISNEAEKGNGAGAGFKGTGALEAVADLAIRLIREKEKEEPEAEYVPVKIKVAKNRHGYSGMVDNYQMWLKSGKFEEILIPYAMYATNQKNPQKTPSR